MTPPLDTSEFPVGPNLDYEDPEEVEGLAALAAEARTYVQSFRWARPIADVVLAFGLQPIIGLFLVQFTEGIPGEGQGDTEVWTVVGDLPSMYFETEDARTPARALELYCAVAQDWADNVLSGTSLADSYPIPVAPTREHAEMLLSRIEWLRLRMVPEAKGQAPEI
jgi:hypothetical protein